MGVHVVLMPAAFKKSGAGALDQRSTRESQKLTDSFPLHKTEACQILPTSQNHCRSKMQKIQIRKANIAVCMFLCGMRLLEHA